jgi:putative transposase
MPRIARIKFTNGIYHVMVRSASEIILFKDFDDKNRYLMLIKKYQQIFHFKVYAYCLMSNHGHIAIDCCGADISKIMKAINQSYTAYFNKRYDRHGHLFQDRFKSKLIDSNRYLVTVSAYIHNNPRDIFEFSTNVEKYKHSSLGIYLGIFKDTFGILNTEYILSHFSSNKANGRKSYLELINRLSNASESPDIEFLNDASECSNERKILVREFKTENIVAFISRYTETPFNIHIKYNHKNSELKSLFVVIMRSLCNYDLKKISQILGNTPESSMSRICNKGYNLITKNAKYNNLIDDFIEEYSAI